MVYKFELIKKVHLYFFLMSLLEMFSRFGVLIQNNIWKDKTCKCHIVFRIKHLLLFFNIMIIPYVLHLLVNFIYICLNIVNYD